MSFIATNIPANGRLGDTVGDAETILEVEARRTDIEDRIREAKLGAALRKLPSGDQAVNNVWMWAALIAGNPSVLLQALTGIDHDGGTRRRRQAATLSSRIRVKHNRQQVVAGWEPQSELATVSG